MATVSTRAAWRKAIIEELSLVAELSGVDVVHTPDRELRSEAIWLGKTTESEVEEHSLVSGRRKRQERYTVELYVRVSKYPDAPTNEARCDELVGHIEDVLADDPKAGDVDGVLAATFVGAEMDSGFLETNAVSQVICSIDVLARLV